MGKGWLAATALGLCGLLSVGSHAADRHQGVATCASSLCHGATAPLGDYPIRQDEYFVWQRQDPHAKAHQTLHSAESRKIGAALGINAATDPDCLSCHAEVASPALRGPQSHASDGISCEACHGGAERWLAEHTRHGITLAEKVSLGMTPTWQRDTRAALCLGCHQGDAEHRITHAMMAAGHPRLVFELDTFSALQPPHYDRDADYAQRKAAYEPVRDWIAGQAKAAELHLQALADGRLMNGLMPEWMQFDCSACHHRMDAARGQPARMPGAAPGAVPFADGPAQLIALWLAAVAPAEVAGWREGQRQLHRAQTQGGEAVRRAAQQQLVLLRTRLGAALTQSTPNSTQLRSLARSLARDAAHANAPLTNEQRAMALTVVADSLRQQGAALPAKASQAIESYYQAVGSVDGFEPRAHALALEAVARALP